ncbi:beta-microseminoprotein [Mycteria americana]|uniref:beta-microseminoprotein n=1 Tax=Mycteria americana TaxID=33587 RepID=UPI003F586656
MTVGSFNQTYEYLQALQLFSAIPKKDLKTILACLLVLAISVTLSNAQCFFQPLEASMFDGEIAGCRISDGELHEFGSTWRNEDCYNCICSTSGISCCSSYARPVGYSEECVSIFNKEICAYEVVEKADHSKACAVHEWVG